ncbi:uncharacterized protein EAF01_001597 [Botrytis porri]|uniref:2EXR domain-containing protein n=1 Tax=Botrytis porri TaxID=87229 RepID=A0A4Z1L029_9HELO|nr:uncharacterized protein EAF01_001597 [Botrytis porri]KAF7912576.1 hypothetical protein EAF01_001597 [Botrytis porri]TGO90127.1 hypothetical protein BPOR_0078g00170 [Botrytis porri]
MTSKSFLVENPSRYPELSTLSMNVFYAQKNKDIKQCKSNCRNIDVDILYPTSYPFHCHSSKQSNKDKESRESMSFSPVDSLALSEYSSHDFSSPINNNNAMANPSFPFLSLPLEIRLKIYLLLLPPRHHKITTQIPHNGYYFPPKCLPLCAAQSFYPLSPDTPDKLTTYKVLSTNSHTDHPNPSIHTRILSVCKQTKEEAEEVLYGNGNSIWDFGMHVEAVQPFWMDRSQDARGWARNLKIAREVPEVGMGVGGSGDVVWGGFYGFITGELVGLKSLDLTAWGNPWMGEARDGSEVVETGDVMALDGDEAREVRKSAIKARNSWSLRDWEYMKELLAHEGLRSAKVTCWGFREGVKSSWAKWMLERRSLMEEMVREGEVVQDVLVWNGGGSGN